MLTACGSLTYSVQIETGGVRTLSLRVYYEDMTDENIAYAKAFLEDYSRRRNESGRQTQVIEGENYISLREEFDNATDYYIALGYTGNEPNDGEAETIDLNAYFYQYVVDQHLVDKADVLGLAFRYAVGDYAQKNDGSLLQLWQAYLGGFVAMPTSPLYSVYSELVKVELNDLLAATVTAMEGDKGDLVAADLAGWLAAKGYDLEAVDFRYSYEHVYKSVEPQGYTRSYTNSDTGATVYEWDMQLADLSDATFTIYQTVPRAWAWELTAVGIGLVTIGVVLTIILMRRRNKHHAAREREQ